MDDELRYTDDYETFDTESEAERDDIQALLDIGYEQLDGFVAWLEENLGLSTRIAQQDAFNAEALIDYLANHQHKSAEEINEFELRWFLFSQYIRKAMADDETELRLLASLQRFFQYLATHYAMTLPGWLHDVLEDQDYFVARRNAYRALSAENERAWKEGFQEWCYDLETDLDARALWLPRDMGVGMAWGDVMGWREATLQEEANAQWQRERETLLQQGFETESVRQNLIDTYLMWLDNPQDKLDGFSPREVIADERFERAEAGEDTQDEDIE